MEWVTGFRAREMARLRAALGLTLDEVARAIGVRGRSRVAEWENGRGTPEPATLLALARVLRCSPFDLLAGGTATPTLGTLRSAAGLTRIDAARRIGLSRYAYQRLEAGQRQDLPAGLVRDLATAFAVDERTVLAAHQRSRAHFRKTHAGAEPTLRTLRRSRSITVQTVAARLGVNDRTWYRMEGGRHRIEPGRHRIEPGLPPDWPDQLADLYGVTPAEVIAAYHASRRRAAAAENGGRA